MLYVITQQERVLVMPIYIPKQIVTLSPTHKSPLLFLAGPIRGGGDWQTTMAEEILLQENSTHIACPVRWGASHRLAQYFHLPFSEAKNRALVWERHYLEQAGLEKNVLGCVIFWLPREHFFRRHPGPQPYAMNTRRKIGKFIAYSEMNKNVRLVMGGDRAFHGLDEILFEFTEAFGKPLVFHKTIKDVVCAAFDRARQ